MKPMLKTHTQACCCLVCVISCPCEGCVIYRYLNPGVEFEAKKLFFKCINDLARLKPAEKKEFLFAKIAGFPMRVTLTNKYFINYQLGEGPEAVHICREAFEAAYRISHWYTDSLVCRLKSGERNTAKDFIDRTSTRTLGVNDQNLSKFCQHFGISLSRQQYGRASLPNSVQSLTSSAWMGYYFKLVGDNPPNRCEELHLEPIPKKEIYDEYKHDIESYGDGAMKPLTIKQFLQVWKDCFPHVKIRKFKHCCGKCNLCSALSELRRSFNDSRGRQEVTMLFILHRLTYMGEREAYYSRRQLAFDQKWKYMSTITDGMQQNRCLLPWFGHSRMPSQHIKQHLQGILMHGRNIRMYRSFANVSVNASYYVHTWLLSLEEQYLEGRLPNTIFHQIDGGSENANVLYLAICYLLVACGLVSKVVLTRLLPGHTHEDIDALFALLWTLLRNEFVYSPSEFKTMIMMAFEKFDDVKVIDVFAFPNYADWVAPFIDPSLGYFAKTNWTQLQFTFERVGDTEGDRYPHFVKSTYQAYAQQEVIEIVDDPKKDVICPTGEKENITGLIPQLTRVTQRPLDTEEPLLILKSLPPKSHQITVDPFIKGSREIITDCCDRMINTYKDKNPAVARDWIKWRDEVTPKTNIATDYIAENPLHIPFFDVLFNGPTISKQYANVGNFQKFGKF